MSFVTLVSEQVGTLTVGVGTAGVLQTQAFDTQVYSVVEQSSEQEAVAEPVQLSVPPQETVPWQVLVLVPLPH
jgi:hypothetical protein